MSTSSKRFAILSQIKTDLQAIKKGALVGGVDATAVYENSVGLVLDAVTDVTNFSESEMPAILIVQQEPTTYITNGDAESYTASMPVSLLLFVKDFERPDIRNSRVAELLESFFFDVNRAMHVHPNALNAADVGVILRSYDPAPVADPDFGAAIVTYSIEYQQMSF